jgi:RNA-directed DNA polymerase
MEEILLVAYRRCRANRGAPGCDGQSFEQIEKQGRDQWLERLRQELRAKQYQPKPLLRVWIPKANGESPRESWRPIGLNNEVSN